MAHWATALTDYARSIDPSRLPADVLVAYDDRTLTICDMYPKAQYHYLVLPRIPFSLTTEEQDEVERTRKEEGERKELWGKAVRRPDEGPSSSPPEATKAKQPQQQRLNLAGGTIRIAPAAGKPESQLTSSSSSSSRSDSQEKGVVSIPSSSVPSKHLASLSTLLASPYRSIVLRSLALAAEKAKKRIESLMPQTSIVGGERAGCTWNVMVGFHAVPSMQTVHCHVFSSELVSERLKNKKHYLSFHPTSGFFLPLSSLLPTSPSSNSQGSPPSSSPSAALPPSKLPFSPSHYESLLKGPLVSHVDGKTYANIPALKRHLNEAWLGMLRAKREAEQGTLKADMDDVTEDEDEDEERPPAKRQRTEGAEPAADESRATKPQQHQGHRPQCPPPKESHDDAASNGSHTESETEDEV